VKLIIYSYKGWWVQGSFSVFGIKTYSNRLGAADLLIMADSGNDALLPARCLIAEAEAEVKRARSKEAEWLFKYIMAAQIAVYMEAGAVPALLNELVRIFKMSYSEQGVLGGIVYITISLGCPLATYLFQNYSPKYVLAWSLILNNCAVVLFASTPEGYSKSFICARALIGFTQAFLAVYVPVWIDHMAPPEKQTAWFSYLQASTPVGVMLGYLAGFGAVSFDDQWAKGDSTTSQCSFMDCWRYPFIAQAVLITPLCIGMFFVVSESTDSVPFVRCFHPF